MTVTVISESGIARFSYIRNISDAGEYGALTLERYGCPDVEVDRATLIRLEVTDE